MNPQIILPWRMPLTLRFRADKQYSWRFAFATDRQCAIGMQINIKKPSSRKGTRTCDLSRGTTLVVSKKVYLPL